jgi:DNA replication factor GINS
MNVEELRSVQRTERQKDSLQHLRDSFYRDVADYVADRKAERERAAEAADDPFSSPEVSRLTDEIETAEEVVESIYERRVGKIVKRATFAAAGMATEDEGLTTEERDLFEDLVDRIETNRDAVLETLAEGDGATGDAADRTDEAATRDAGGESAPPPASPPPEAADAPQSQAGTTGDHPNPDDLLAEAMGGEDGGTAPGGDPSSPDSGVADEPSQSQSQGTPPPADADDSPAPDGGADVAGAPDRTTLRITRDVGSIFGVDEREYDLATEDVVTLPTPNAEPLLEKDAAERLDAE